FVVSHFYPVHYVSISFSRSKADQLGDTGEPENKRQRVFNEGPDNEREGEKKGDFEVLRHRDGRGGERNERGGKEAGGDDDGPRNGDERGGEKTAGDNEGLLSRIL
ncbi:hypothetical protein GBF38_012777, partial [Nibea albiflora]